MPSMVMKRFETVMQKFLTKRENLQVRENKV